MKLESDSSSKLIKLVLKLVLIYLENLELESTVLEMLKMMVKSELKFTFSEGFGSKSLSQSMLELDSELKSTSLETQLL